jgi:hypothetical protein
MFRFNYNDEISLDLPLPHVDSAPLYALIEESRDTLAQ